MEREGKIRELLDAYFEGTTSLGQEAELKEYFAMVDNIPQDLLYAREMFGFYGRAAGETCDSVVLPEDGLQAKKKRKLWAWGAVAAAAVLLAAGTLLYTRPDSPQVYCYLNGEPVTDIVLAQEQFHMAAKIVKEGFDVTTEGISKIEKAVVAENNAVEQARRLLELVSRQVNTADPAEEDA